jgi:hypothetical protein
MAFEPTSPASLCTSSEMIARCVRPRTSWSGSAAAWRCTSCHETSLSSSSDGIRHTDDTRQYVEYTSPPQAPPTPPPRRRLLPRRRLRALLPAVVSVAYRLAPGHRFPAAYDDGVAARRASTCPAVFSPGTARPATSSTTWPSAGRPRRRRQASSASPAPSSSNRSSAARSGRTGRGGGARRGHPAAVDGGDGAFLEGVLAGGRHPGPRGGARVRRGRRPGAGVPGRHGGDRRVRPAQGLAAGKVRGDPVREGEAGPGG